MSARAPDRGATGTHTGDRAAAGARVLLVDDDLAFRESTAELLRQDGYEVVSAPDGVAGAAALERERFDVVLLDLRMPGPDGVAIADALRRRGERVPILMISGFGTIDGAVHALHHGVDDFLTKPVEPSVLSERVAALIRRRPHSATQSRAARSTHAAIVGSSPAIREVLSAIAAVAPTTATVLISGETGTGKELIARAIHASSGRPGAFVAANCAAIAPGVLESELFGHVRGAFTGAVQDRPGLFRAAERGTVFLDEIGDLPLDNQRALLRVLQEREVTPVGGTRPVRVDVRVIAATHRDLRAAVTAGAFREDLFYRLSVFPIPVAPLRARRDDIPLLAEALLASIVAPGVRAPTVTALAMHMLRGYAWPGNVRELRAALESAVIRAGDGGRIDVQHLPDSVRPGGTTHDADARYRSAGPDDERSAIVLALEAAGGVKQRAAELLGMGRTTLWRKLRQYGLLD